MKILQVTPRYPPQSGGVETHVKEISERLVKRGHEVTVVTADAGKDGERRERRSGVTVRRYRSIAPNDAMHLCPQIVMAVRESEADVVHAHNYHSFPLFFAALGIGDHRFVVTTHYHGGSANSVRDHLLSLYHPLGRWAVRRADVIVAVSEWEREQLRSDFDTNATVIPNGVDVDRFAKAKPVERERPYMLTVGRLEAYKGIQHAIRALPNLPEYDLLVIGSGPYRETLEQIASESGVEDRVEFMGYVDADTLPGLYSGAEVYLTLSEFESYGMTVSEAISAGTPCVVRQAAGLRNWNKKDCVVGVEELTPEVITESVHTAATREPSPRRLPTWNETTTELLSHYD
ncbi:glycosyltransferase family 4 protein [Halobellus ruber]|uniref:Glycosyltransferase family 4 protein n=1 Tax=Halobellus ruber TaxID=2761102 RepID=A0A7J9SCS7_9EURY|nr:glycosyltransferase family 4 protein [Halobellus ruber]MBB6644710.1 glycosyltransferase family 4 protein [Halobellus ruber]